MTTELNAREALLRAADLIEQFGWIQENYGGRDMGFCSLGAVQTVICEETGKSWFDGEKTDLYLGCMGRLQRAIGETDDDAGRYTECRVLRWNDYEARSMERVLEVFRNAAWQE